MKKSFFQKALGGAALAALLASCAPKVEAPYTAVNYADLPNWQGEVTLEQHKYLDKVCTHWQRRRSISVALYGSLKTWQNTCKHWLSCSEEETTQCFKQLFKPVKLSAQQPLYTGYYAPIFKGSAQQTEVYNTPLRAIPDDLIRANLGQFDEELKGKCLVGRIKGNRFVPYAQRKEIDEGGVKSKPLVWMKEEEAFFMHIQGSGTVALEDGTQVHVAYGQNNGHKYHAIGRTLVHNGYLKREDVSMQSIKQWLVNASERNKKAVLYSNPRYIFFTKGDGVVRGSFNTALEANLSLAVDPSYVPLGAPVWVNTTVNKTDQPLQKMMFATDTGGAIEGAVRGDIYFGKGDIAGEKAGLQNFSGEMFIFIPRK